MFTARQQQLLGASVKYRSAPAVGFGSSKREADARVSVVVMLGDRRCLVHVCACVCLESGPVACTHARVVGWETERRRTTTHSCRAAWWIFANLVMIPRVPPLRSRVSGSRSTRV